MMSSKIFLVGGILITSEIIWQLYKRFCDIRKRAIDTYAVSKRSVNEPKRNILEVMFFSKESSFCRAHAAHEKACLKDTCPVRYLRSLENYLSSAKQSLDVCMHMLTCKLLSTAIVNAHKRGIHVRIIMDQSRAFNNNTQTAMFHKNGVAVKMQHPDVLMHHKFVIVDSDIVITGSMNWTMSAFFGNFENIFVTNYCSLVKPFVEEFEKLWITFEHPVSSKLEENLERLA